jgi:thioredoxin 1
MSKIETVEQLVEAIEESTKPVIVKFSSKTCGPCRMLAPILKKVEEENDITLIELDVDEVVELAMEQGVTSVPTTFFYQNGQEVFRKVGLFTADKLDDFLA